MDEDTNLFDIIKLSSVTYEEKIKLLIEYRHIDYFLSDSNEVIRDYAASQKKKQQMVAINKRLKKLGIGGV